MFTSRALLININVNVGSNLLLSFSFVDLNWNELRRDDLTLIYEVQNNNEKHFERLLINKRHRTEEEGIKNKTFILRIKNTSDVLLEDGNNEPEKQTPKTEA